MSARANPWARVWPAAAYRLKADPVRSDSAAEGKCANAATAYKWTFTLLAAKIVWYGRGVASVMIPAQLK